VADVRTVAAIRSALRGQTLAPSRAASDWARAAIAWLEALARRLAGAPPANSVRHNGAHYPVNGDWHELNTRPFRRFAVADSEHLMKVAKGLLDRSRRKPLSTDEQARLDAAVRHYNVRNSIDWLNGRPLSDFGFDGYDQVHGNYVRFPGGCDCVLRIVFEHHGDLKPGRRDNGLPIWAHTPAHVCDKHARWARDPETLQARVIADNPAPTEGEVDLGAA
jgi:hypothetical protein